MSDTISKGLSAANVIQPRLFDFDSIVMLEYPTGDRKYVRIAPLTAGRVGSIKVKYSIAITKCDVRKRGSGCRNW